MEFKRIVCTDQVPFGNPPQCAWIVSVGVSKGGDAAQEQLSVEEVIQQMKQGVQFYTRGVKTGKTAIVESYWCLRCSKYHIRSKADAIFDNNLDSLRFCAWKAA